MSKNILVLLHLSESEKALLERKAPSCSFVYADRKSLTAEMSAGQCHHWESAS